MTFLKKLRKRNSGIPLAIFMDNLSVHKTHLVRGALEKYEIEPIFCVPYSPQFNGIESYWFLIKQEYKKSLLQAIQKGLRLSVVKFMKAAIKNVD